MNSKEMKTMRMITVEGKRATHTIGVLTQTFATFEECANRYDELSDGKWRDYQPDNGAEFKTEGAAIGWLKKFLKKDGWPDATEWRIVTWKVAESLSSNLAISVYLIVD